MVAGAGIANNVGCRGLYDLPDALAEFAQDVPSHPDGVAARWGPDDGRKVPLEGLVVFSGQCVPGSDHVPCHLFGAHAVGMDGPVGEGIARLTLGLQRANPPFEICGLEQDACDRAAPALLLSLEPFVNRLWTRLQADHDAGLLHEFAVALVHRNAASGRHYPMGVFGCPREAVPL